MGSYENKEDDPVTIAVMKIAGPKDRTGAGGVVGYTLPEK